MTAQPQYVIGNKTLLVYDSPRSLDRGMIERTGANGEIIDILITGRADVLHKMATTKDQMLMSAPLNNYMNYYTHHNN